MREIQLSAKACWQVDHQLEGPEICAHIGITEVNVHITSLALQESADGIHAHATSRDLSHLLGSREP